MSTLAVRMDMTIDDGHTLAELTPRMPADVRARIHDQLWVAAVLREQRARIGSARRTRFTERADRILALLDPQEEPDVQAPA